MTLKKASFLSIGSLALAVMLGGCTSPQYDPKADTAIGDLQSKIHGQIDGWLSKTKPPTFEKNAPFYDEIDTSLTSLQIRMQATPDPSTANLPVVFSDLHQSINSMRYAQERRYIERCIPGRATERARLNICCIAHV